MTIQTYQHLIIEGIKGLPEETLAEITNFIFFLRKRMLQPQAFQEELQSALLGAELRQLSCNHEAHLEQEFEDYGRLYPRE